MVDDDDGEEPRAQREIPGSPNHGDTESNKIPNKIREKINEIRKTTTVRYLHTLRARPANERKRWGGDNCPHSSPATSPGLLISEEYDDCQWYNYDRTDLPQRAPSSSSSQ